MANLQRSKFRQLLVIGFGFVLISITVFALAQNKREEKKETVVKDLVIRESKNSMLLKDPSKFEFFKDSDGVAVRNKSTRSRVAGGFMMCGVCPGGDCLTVIEGPRFRCVGCSGHGQDCTLNVRF